MIASEGSVRPRHVLSALASGAVAGLWANLAVALCLTVTLGLAGSSIPPVGFDSWHGLVGSAVGAVLVGLFYVNLIGWLPKRLLARSVVFAVLGAPVLAGIHATAYGVTPTVAPDSPSLWIVASALGSSLATPICLRAVLMLTVRSTESFAVLPITHSIFLVGVILLGPFRDPATVASIVSAAPLGSVLLMIAIVALGLASWSIGVRPADRRPRWYGAVGWTLAGIIALTGSAMVAGAIDGWEVGVVSDSGLPHAGVVA